MEVFGIGIGNGNGKCIKFLSYTTILAVWNINKCHDFLNFFFLSIAVISPIAGLTILTVFASQTTLVSHIRTGIVSYVDLYFCIVLFLFDCRRSIESVYSFTLLMLSI